MKRRVLSVLLALLTLLSLCVPALAAAGPADEPAPIARTVSPSTPSAAVRKAAQTVFDEYYDAYYNGRTTANTEDVMFWHEIYTPFGECKDFWYTFYDLDKNGSAELFIGALPDGSDCSIVDAYEFVGGRAVKLYPGGAPGYKELMTPLSDGRFRVDAARMNYYTLRIYQLSKNGQAAKLVSGYGWDTMADTYSDIVTAPRSSGSPAGRSSSAPA